MAADPGNAGTCQDRPVGRTVDGAITASAQDLHQPVEILCFGEPMTDQISYMDTAAATDVGVYYKRRSVAGLALQAGQTVVDIGCGPGTDLGRLAGAVAPGGSAIGVDRDPSMLAEARRRHAATAGVDVRAGDVHDLPFADGSVDRAR